MSGFSSSNGRLFGVGLGPGDPDLVTIKATKIIAAVPVVAYFAKKGARGKARAILDRWVGDTCLQLPLLYPLTTETHFCDPAYTQELRAFYSKGGGRHRGASIGWPRCRSRLRGRPAFLWVLHASLCPVEGSLRASKSFPVSPACRGAGARQRRRWPGATTS